MDDELGSTEQGFFIFYVLTVVLMHMVTEVDAMCLGSIKAFRKWRSS